MTSIFAEITRERSALLAAIADLDTAILDRPNTVADRSIKDILSHLAGWQEWMLRAYPARLAQGELPADLRVAEDDIDTWNRRFADERREQSTEAIIQELDTGLTQLLTFAANLGATRLAAPNPWPGARQSIAGYLREFVAGHDREHREEIERALGRAKRATV